MSGPEAGVHARLAHAAIERPPRTLPRSPLRAGALRRPRRLALLTPAVGLAAALPVLAATVRALHEGWQPVADRGIIATRAFDVFSSHMPLVGQYSYAGNVTGKLTYSLGPMIYWLLAPAAHLGAPATLALTVAAVNVACIMGAVALARRRGGPLLMIVAAIAIALMCRSLAAQNFYDIWNPSAALLPLTLLMFVCWSLACGDHRLLPLAALLASFCAQCEDAFVPPTVALLAVALVGLALQRRLLNRWALAALAVLAVCWTPPVVDQVAHSGNLGLVLRAASERNSSLGAHVGARAVARAVGVPPWWLVRPASPWERKLQVRRPLSPLAAITAAAMLAWLLIAFALALRRRRADVAAAAAVSLALCAALAALASATPTKPLLAETLGYTLWWASPAGMFVWLAAGWAAVVLGLELLPAARRLRGRLRPWSALGVEHPLAISLGALALVALAGGSSAASGRPDEHANEFPALGTINARLGSVPRGHTVLLNAQLDGILTPLRPEITFALRRRGVRALGTGAYLRLGLWYEKWAHPYDRVLWLYDRGRSPIPGATVIARTSVDSGGVRHPVTLVMASAAAAARASANSARASADSARASADAARRSSGAAAQGWSAPATLASGCSLASVPQVAFPSEGPSLPTGSGAVLWVAEQDACARAAPLRPAAPAARLSVSPIGAGERPQPPSVRALAGGFSGALAAAGASLGRVAVAAGQGSGGGSAAVMQISAGHALGTRTARVPGLPLSLAHAYLGDVAIATAARGAIEVRVERHYAHGFEPAESIPIAPGPVTALAATMDFRSDVLVAWQQNGSIYAHMLRASRRREPTQRLGASAPAPQLQALVSDNDHGMVAWSSTRAQPGALPHTRVYVDLSAAGVRFGAPRVIASFEDPAQAGRSEGSLQLVRLSSENVVMAWTAREGGHYVVRAAPAVFAASRPTALLSDPGRQAVLAALAAGPAGEALALWTSTPRDTPSAREPRTQLWVARTFVRPGDRVALRPPEAIASTGPVAGAQVAIDPADDRALAAWLQPAPRSIRYSLSRGQAGYRPHGPPPSAVRAPGSAHWLRIALAALGALLLVALAAAAMWRARRRDQPARR